MLFPDHFTPAHQAGSRERVERTLATLQPGVTEVHVQPMIDTPEVRALSPNWEAWVDDHELVVHDEALADALAQLRARTSSASASCALRQREG